jgi:antitoxin YefM
MYGVTVRYIGSDMNSISANKFRNNLKHFVQNGDDFVVLSADDWEREQETLYVLQNNVLIVEV